MYERHVANRDSRPQVIDLFSGAGGFSLGFEQAGFDIAAAVELDPVHAATHHFNFPGSTIFPRSVADLTGDQIRAEASLDQERPLVLIGGPPCQGFSLIGQRVLDDPRNGLVRQYLRLVAELQPDYFVFENVKGLTVGNHRKFLTELIKSFDRIGYTITTPWRVLNASAYGVPQNRERLILLGTRSGLPAPSYPAPQTTTFGEPSKLDPMPRTPTVRDALDDLPDIDRFDALLDADNVELKSWPKIRSEYARVLRCERREDWAFGYIRHWNPALLTGSARTDHTEISRARFSDTPHGETEPVSRFLKLPPSGQSNTLRAGTDSARGAFTSPRPIHYKFPRCISVREMARLHGYPDWFRFHVTKWHGARQVGNSVPPPLARAIADEIARALDYRPKRPRKLLNLGDVALLSLTNAQAAEHFGVPNPIGARDRKSGARKRSQFEVEEARKLAAGAENR